MIIVQVRLIDARGRGYITDEQYAEFIEDGMTPDDLITVQLVAYPTTYSQASVSVSGSGQITLVTPTSGKALNIVRLYMKTAQSFDDTITYVLKMGGTSKTGSIPISNINDLDFGFYPIQGTTNQLFTITLSDDIDINGFVIYFET